MDSSKIEDELIHLRNSAVNVLNENKTQDFHVFTWNGDYNERSWPEGQNFLFICLKVPPQKWNKSKFSQ